MLNRTKENRTKENWMSLTKEQINDLTLEDWLHYKNGGCLCSALCSCECCCGSWFTEGKVIKNA
jgi:hypothetical protein